MDAFGDALPGPVALLLDSELFHRSGRERRVLAREGELGCISSRLAFVVFTKGSGGAGLKIFVFLKEIIREMEEDVPGDSVVC